MASGITEARLRAETLEGHRGRKALPLRQWKRSNDALSPTLSRDPSSFLLPSWGSPSPLVSCTLTFLGEIKLLARITVRQSIRIVAQKHYYGTAEKFRSRFDAPNVHDDEWRRQSAGWCVRLSHQPRELLLIQHLPHSVLFMVLAKLQTTAGHGLSILQNHKC